MLAGVQASVVVVVGVQALAVVIVGVQSSTDILVGVQASADVFSDLDIEYPSESIRAKVLSPPVSVCPKARRAGISTAGVDRPRPVSKRLHKA